MKTMFSHSKTKNHMGPGKGSKGAAILALALTAVLFGGCLDDQESISAIVDPLHAQIEQREKELSALRSTETSLKSQIAGLEEKVSLLEKNLEETRKENEELKDSQSGDPEEMKEMIAQAVRESLSAAGQASTAAPPHPGQNPMQLRQPHGTYQQQPSNVTGGGTGAVPMDPGGSSGTGRGQLPPPAPGVKRYKMN
jgi:cell division protein FtsB